MKQKKKKGLSILVLAAGLLLQFTGICIGPVHFRMISGICIGIGAVFFSLSVHQLYRLSCEKSFPDLVHLEQIEKRDERNIHNRLVTDRIFQIPAFILQIFCLRMRFIITRRHIFQCRSLYGKRFLKR